MAIITNFYEVDSRLGADLNNPETIVSTNPSVPAARAVPGAIVQGIAGSQWVFVKASTTVTALNVVMIDESFNANNAQVTSGVVSLNKTLGLAEFQVSNAQPGDYFWAAVAGRGGMLVNVQSTAAAAVQMYISSSTPGAMTTTASSSATNCFVRNCYVAGALTGTTAAVEVVFSYMQASV